MKTKSTFYKIYFTVIAIFFVVLIVGLAVLFKFLNSYENSQPSTIVNTVVNNYIKTANIYDLIKDYDVKISDYESTDNLTSLLKEYIGEDKEISASHSSLKPDDIDEAYVIKSGDQKIINIYLKKKTTGSGYNVSYLEVNKNLLKTVEINVPKGIKVTVNGVELKDDIRKDNKLPTLPSKIDTKTLTVTQTATLSNMLSSEPEIKAYDGDKELTVKCEGTSYTIASQVDSAIATKVQDTAKNAAIAYTAYMQKDGSLGKLATYCDTSCDFYRNVASSLVQFVKSHNGYKDTDFMIGDVIAYSDAVYSCRIKYNHTLLLGTSTYTDVFDKVVFVTKNNETYKVIDMQSVSEAE